MRRYLAPFVVMVIFTASCTPKSVSRAELPLPVVTVERFTPTAGISQLPSTTPTLSANLSNSILLTTTPSVTPSLTPDPYREMYIEALAARKYGGGVLEDLGSLNSSSGAFSRRLFRYRSEGLNLYGFINLPEGEGPFPLIIMLHGYVNPQEYKTLDYSTRYADALAEAGYIVLHPNLRGYAPSPEAENAFGIGDTVDILNLLSLSRQSAGVDGLLKKADGTKIGLWGHSMGGGIVLRILTIEKDIQAALLYASINADEKINLMHFEEDGRGTEEISAPDEILERISPLGYLDRINTPISIHHGDADSLVPVEWSEDLCQHLKSKGKSVDCLIYEGQPHTFRNSGDTQFIANMISFFDGYMKK